MLEDEPFLRAILAHPDDRVSRLVYADWLDDRSDSRAEYVRLEVRVAELPHGHGDRPALQHRLLELQATLQPWWVSIVGGLRLASKDERMILAQLEEVVQTLGRPAKRTDADGYNLEIEAVATSGMTGAVAYLESRSKWSGNNHDIHYHLYLRDTTGHTIVWEPYTYNPYFGCDTKFLEWHGDAVLFIYREKHSTYAARFGFDTPARYHKLEDYWVLDGREFYFIKYRKPEVCRLSAPNLEVLPSLTVEEATRLDLMPAIPSWWLTG